MENPASHLAGSRVTRRISLSLVPATTRRTDDAAAEPAAAIRWVASERSPLAVAQRLIDPVIAAAIVPATCALAGEAFARPHQLVAALAAAACLSRFGATGMYRAYGTAPLGATLRRVATAWAWIAVALAGVALVGGALAEFSAGFLAAWAVATPLALALGHATGRAALRALQARGVGLRTAVVAGGGTAAFDFVRHVRANPACGVRVIGFFEDHALAGRLCDLPVLGSLADAAAYVQAHRIDHVFVAPPAGNALASRALLDALSDTTAAVSILPQVAAPAGQVLDLDDVAGAPVLTWSDAPFADSTRRALKRASDLALAGLGLVVAAPVMVVVAIAVKLTSRGPVLFRQRRHGADGQEIVVYKFRTMSVMEDGARVAQAQRNDPRVTPLGRILRKTSLDELPQLINVLQGRMSVIGPRPHALAHNEHYRRLIPGYMRRHTVKPGLSGWAQVHGWRGETRTVDDMRGRVECDLYYQRNWSLWLDLRVVLKTLKVLVRDPKAY